MEELFNGQLSFADIEAEGSSSKTPVPKPN